MLPFTRRRLFVVLAFFCCAVIAVLKFGGMSKADTQRNSVNNLPVGPQEISIFDPLVTQRRLKTTASFSPSIPEMLGGGSNPAAITINALGAATPSPSNITVSGMTGVITDVEVTLNGFSHSSRMTSTSFWSARPGPDF